MSALVSLIIPTKNSSRTLDACLGSLRSQNYIHIEIIVVDNFSTDTTFDIAKKYTDKVYRKGPERTLQKNYGIEVSQGEYLAFIDSDMVLNPEVISEAITLMSSHRNIGGICIPERSIGEGLFARLRDYERSFYRGTPIESARFFRKKDVVAVGGFEEGIIFFEESLLPQKIERILKLDTHYSIEPSISHLEGDITLFSWLKKKFYYGKSILLYRDTTKSVGIKETQEGQTAIWSRFKIFLMNKKFYEKPFIALGVLGLKSLEFAAGGLGMIVYFLKNRYEK